MGFCHESRDKCKYEINEFIAKLKKAKKEADRHFLFNQVSQVFGLTDEEFKKLLI